MFLWSFLFLASSCARSHLCGLATVDRGGKAPSPPLARGWGLGRPPHRRCPEVFRRRGSSAARLLPRGSPRSTPPNLSGSASSRPAAQVPRADRAAVCARLAPRSVQLFPLGDPPGVGEMSTEPLGWEEREQASIPPRRPAPWATLRTRLGD